MANLAKCSVLILVLLLGIPVLAAQAETVSVIGVVDGDTCILRNGERVRYYGINAPEKGDPQFNEATEVNNNLVTGKEVRLEPQDPSRDKDDRLLGKQKPYMEQRG